MRPFTAQWVRSVAVGCAVVLLCGCTTRDSTTSAEETALATDELRATIHRVVTDDTTRLEMLTLLNALDSEIASMSADIRERREQIRRLNADYDATREELAALVDEATLSILGYRNRIVNVRRVLASKSTPEQWEQIRKAEAKAARVVADSLIVYGPGA
jgi:chromosome segregation ATPase